MARFTDTKNREWSLDLNVELIEKLQRHELALDLLETIDPDKCEAVYRRLAHPITLCRVLCVLLEEQLTARGVKPSDFGAGLGGDAIDAAASALDEALVDFSPSRLRPMLRAAREKILEMERRNTERKTKLLNDPRVEALVARTLDDQESSLLDDLENRLRHRTADGSAGSSAARSASIRAD